MKKALLFLLALSFAAPSFAQTPTPYKSAIITHTTSTPGFVCSAYERFHWNSATDVLSFCENGVWIAVAGAGFDPLRLWTSGAAHHRTVSLTDNTFGPQAASFWVNAQYPGFRFDYSEDATPSLGVFQSYPTGLSATWSRGFGITEKVLELKTSFTAGSGVNARFRDGNTADNQTFLALYGFRVHTSGTKPTCSSTTDGFQWWTDAFGGAADLFEVCMRNAGGTYAWRALALAP